MSHEEKPLPRWAARFPYASFLCVMFLAGSFFLRPTVFGLAALAVATFCTTWLILFSLEER